MVKRKSNINEQEEILKDQLPDFDADNRVEQSSVGQKINPIITGASTIDKEGFEEFEKKVNASKLGDNIFQNAEARSGWITIDRNLLGERSRFYPEDWVFKVRPATVEAIRNWSMLDENNGNSIDDVFNEILKYCVSITSATSNVNWQAISSWDKFFFVLLVREYTFAKGESNVEFYEDCPSCENPVRYILESQALMYDMPDESVYKDYDPENRYWYIDPESYEINSSGIVMYIPTIEKDINIKNYLISEYNENPNKKFDPVFIKFLPWLCPKISKDMNIAKQQIRKAELTFRGWDTEMFTFMDDVLRNIAVTPKVEISAICEHCGEEATARLRFPNGISSLFNVVNRHKKFGTK